MAIRRLCRPRIVNRVILEVLRQILARIEPLLELRVRDIPSDDDRAIQGELGRHGILPKIRKHFVHGAIEINGDWFAR